MTSSSEKVTVREVRPEDMPFVYSGWFKSWRREKSAGVIPNNRYFELMNEVVENLVGRGSLIKIAECEGVLLGFICYEFTQDMKPVLHYIYIKDPYHKFGIGDLLRDEAFPGLVAPGFYTFNSYQVKKYFSDFRWVPEIARRKDI